MKNIVVRVATIISAFLLILALTLTAFAEVTSGAESIVPINFGTPQNYTLSETTYTYNASVQCPEVTVTNTEGAVIDSIHYTVSYKNNIKPGNATATVTFNNGEISKELGFQILPKKAGKPSLKSAKQKQFTVTVKEDKTVSGYEIMYSTSKKFKNGKTVTLGVRTDVRKTISGVKNNRTYYVKVRGYKNVSGEKLYGKWSNTAKVKVPSNSAHPELPDAMLESYVAKSVTYLGYKTKSQI